MRSKSVTYILLVATVMVWGLIVWKILHRTEEFEVMATEKPPPSPVKTKNPGDSLWLDYRDPFLGEIHRTVTETESEEPVVQVDIPRPVYNVQYHGRIVKNRVENCIIGINGQHFLLRQGMAEEGFRLQKIYEDSVRIEKEGYIFTVPLSQ